MSSSPTARTSTTGSSASCRSRPDPTVPDRTVPDPAVPDQAAPVAVIACGALAGPVREIAARRGWPAEVHSLPAVLHNRPARIAPAVEQLATDLLGTGHRVAVAYADCGSYGALDGLC